MATIREHLDCAMTESRKARVLQLQELGAPNAAITGMMAKLDEGAAKVGKIKVFGDLEFTEVTKHTGLGGKPYMRFANKSGADILFVKGKWGWYLYRQTDAGSPAALKEVGT